LDKNEQEIMVIDRSTLFAEIYFQGFSPAKNQDYQQVILDNYFYQKRGIAEIKPEFKQPIAYCIILNKKTGNVFAYQRSVKDGEYAEKRLQGKWSWGIGGHIDKIDEENGNPIEVSLLREIDEEIQIASFDSPKVLGYINDDETEVGQVHFGILYLIETNETVKPKDKEISFGEFKALHDLQSIYDENAASVESWSGIALTALRDYLA
jgi:predicted NUDIX family phosphoesterase